MRTPEQLVDACWESIVAGKPKSIYELVAEDVIDAALSDLRIEIMRMAMPRHHKQQRLRPRNYRARSKR